MGRDGGGIELERGRLRFYVRPRVMLAAARSFADVQRFFVVLAPEGRDLVRRVAIGRKRMPDPARRDKEWAYVDRIASSFGELLEDVGGRGYETKTEGWRTQAGASEVARGTYAIRPHADHVHLDYALDGEPVLSDLGLAERGSMIAAVFNPEAKSRRGTTDANGPREPSIYSDELQAKFGDKRFAPLEPDFLDHEGCEIVLIGHEVESSAGHDARIDDAIEVETDGDRTEEVPRVRSGRRGAGA